jgi:hypothetical protein
MDPEHAKISAISIKDKLGIKNMTTAAPIHITESLERGNRSSLYISCIDSLWSIRMTPWFIDMAMSIRDASFTTETDHITTIPSYRHLVTAFGLNYLPKISRGRSRQCLTVQHVFRTLENTVVSGRLRHLSDGAILESPKIGPLVCSTFFTFPDIPTGTNMHDGRNCVPIQMNHTSIDFYIPQAGLLERITVGQKHAVKWSNLKATIESGLFYT